MDNENYIITVCPSCACRYRVPEAILGRTVSCKKCGTGFSLGLADESTQKQNRQYVTSEQGKVLELFQDDVYLVIGKLAVKYKFVSDKQLQQALSIQEEGRRAGQNLPLGEVLVVHGMMSQAQLDFLVSVQKMLEVRKLDGKFGTIAVKNEFTTREEIDRALQEQNKIFKETKAIKLIGDILVESKALTENQRNAILKTQKRFETAISVEQKSPDVPDVKERSKTDAEFNLTVSEDKLNAFISINGKGSGTITLDTLRNFLQVKGIAYGIVDDAQIAEYLKKVDGRKEPLKIAEGRPPESGKNADIKYCFQTDPLKVGAIKKGGVIDFKDRGDIPHVKEGDVLVEKIPVIEGRLGTDVYGSPIPPKKSYDTKLKHGKGTKISDDRLKIIAKIEGIPEISAIGKVYVSPQLKISGDIGLKTGHVDFEGKIEVSQAIQNGFRVTGTSLTAKEILKAEIDMTGDIVVYGGIMGATIKTGGNIRARYIRDSRIEAYGDVVVEKELIDSKVDTSGACIVNNGPILSSTVAAKKGIAAITIGSEISNPCKLMVGVDEIIKNEIDTIKETQALKIEALKQLRSRLEEIKDEPKKIEKQIAEMAQVQDKIMVRKRNIQKQMKDLEESGDKSRLKDAEAELNLLDTEMKKGEKNLDNLFDKQEQIAEEIPDIREKITDSKAKIKEMKEKISEISEWSAREKGIPEIRVKGIIYSDTAISGFYTSLKLNQDYKSVLIKEDIIQGVDNRSKLNPDQEKHGSKISIRPLD